MMVRNAVLKAFAAIQEADTDEAYIAALEECYGEGYDDGREAEWYASREDHQ